VQIEQDVETIIDEAIAFAETSPDPKPADLYTDVFKD
jgi:TPP-dependent pyruvate/acetoin dehydrogenase alpha subunit